VSNAQSCLQRAKMIPSRCTFSCWVFPRAFLALKSHRQLHKIPLYGSKDPVKNREEKKELDRFCCAKTGKIPYILEDQAFVNSLPAGRFQKKILKFANEVGVFQLIFQ
jgi:hypothetical protein